MGACKLVISDAPFDTEPRGWHGIHEGGHETHGGKPERHRADEFAAV